MKKIKTTWVIDDDDIYTFAIKRIITRAAVSDNIHFFCNGKMALDHLIQLANNPELLPDLILLDLNMPILDGWQFMDEFIKLRPGLEKDITVYIVSSSIDEDDYTRAKGIKEIADFIIKPLTIEDMRQIVEKL